MEESGTVAARRVLPALPETDGQHGDIRWDRWQPALILTHIDPSCPTCAYPGPLSTATGQTLYIPEPTWVRVERSRPGRRSRWVKTQRDAYRAKTHWATRCPQCDETTVYRMGDWSEIAYFPPTTARALPPADDVLF